MHIRKCLYLAALFTVASITNAEAAKTSAVINETSNTTTITCPNLPAGTYTNNQIIQQVQPDNSILSWTVVQYSPDKRALNLPGVTWNLISEITWPPTQGNRGPRYIYGIHRITQLPYCFYYTNVKGYRNTFNLKLTTPSIQGQYSCTEESQIKGVCKSNSFVFIPNK